MRSLFPGFSPRAITFLRQLERNNTREWFHPRKDQFEELLRRPMLELAGIILDQLRTFAVDHVVDPRKAVHRIYRDVRFSKDKLPYKTYISAMFPPKGVEKDPAALFYFSVSPKQVVIAAGSFRPHPADLAALRNHISTDATAFRRVLDNPKTARVVGPLVGEQLARPPKGFDADHPAIGLLRRKQFYYRLSLPVLAATSPGLDQTIIRYYRAAAPAVSLLNRILRSAASEVDNDQPPQRPTPMF